MATAPNFEPNDELAPVFPKGTDGNARVSDHLNKFGYEDNPSNIPELKAAFDGGGRIEELLGYVDDVRVNRLPTVTPAQHAQDVKGKIEDTDKTAISILNNVGTGLANAIKRTMKQLDADANLTDVDPLYINAVTGAFYGLSQSDKMAEIAKMLESGDGRTMAILINSPELITGLNSEQRESIRLRAHTTANPAGVADLERLTKADARWKQAYSGYMRGITQLGKGLDKYDADIAKSKAIHSKLPGAGFHG